MIKNSSKKTQAVICMSATIYDFKEVSLPDFKFPEFIFLDTSFLINAFCPVPEKPGLPSDTNEKCSEFLDVLKKNAREGKTCLITSDLVVNEFFHFILKEKAEYVELEGGRARIHGRALLKINTVERIEKRLTITENSVYFTTWGIIPNQKWGNP